MKRISGIVAVLALSRIALLAGHDLAWSWWSPAAYLWHDAGALLVYAAVDRGLRRSPRLAWAAYAVFVACVAISVPVSRALSTPMTWPMWRAAGGPLADSVWYYATTNNVLWLVGIIVAAVAPPLSLVSFVVKEPLAAMAIASLAVLVVLGPSAAARVDTHGLERNAWSALVATALPRIAAEASASDWRAPRADRVSAADRVPSVQRVTDGSRPDDLAVFRGAGAGRNVVLVSLESTAAQYLKLYGGAAEDVMPNLSQLAQSAIVFDNAYAVYPESIKGLFSILCSVYPVFDRAAESYDGVPCASVASVLSHHAYRTALFHSGRFAYLGMDAVIRKRGYDLLADAGDIGGNHESSFGVDDRTTVARMLEWIDTLRSGERFFITYLPIAGHHPYEVPEHGPFVTNDEFGRYRNALWYSDTILGELVRGLSARRLDQNTLWIVLGDHGEAFGQHDGNFGHTFQLYDENVHVPLLVSAPGVIPRQVRSRRVVSLIDTAPTLLDLLGVPASASYQGHSALDRESRMALFFADYSLGLLGLRDARFKYIYELDSDRSRLFDLESDPEETRDVADRHAEDVRWYRDRVRGWSAAQKANAQRDEIALRAQRALR